MRVQQLVAVLGLVSTARVAATVFKPDAAEKVTWQFKQRPKEDVARVEVQFRLSDVFQDVSAVRLGGQVGLEVAAGEGEFLPTGEGKLRNGWYKFTLGRVPCLHQRLRLVFSNSAGAEERLELLEPIPASTEPQLAQSSFSLTSPTGVTVEQGEAGVTFTWQPVQCATAYLLSFEGPEGPAIEREVSSPTLVETELEECKEYYVLLTAVAGELYSEEVELEPLTTQPSAQSAASLAPALTPARTGLQASWDGYAALSCVTQYEVSVCRGEECQESTVELDNTLPEVRYQSAEPLQQCSDYTLTIKPLYDGKDLQQISVPFRTLSPGLAAAHASLTSVEAVAEAEQMISVSWAEVECAQEYRVFQQEVGGAGDWEEVGSSVAPSLEIKGVPCTEYRYGVKVVIAGEESEIVEAAETVVTNIDSSVPYSASNLEVMPTTEDVQLSWDHAKCIANYTVEVCRDEDCRLEQLEVDDTATATVSLVVAELAACTPYTLQISATTAEGEQLAAELDDFTSLAPAATAPAGLDAELAESGVVSVSYAAVECAESYRVFLQQDGGEEEMVDTRELAYTTPSLPPCTQYRLAVAAVVGGLEGPRTEYLENVVPPSRDHEATPTISIQDKYNSTIIFRVETPAANEKCQPESYQVKYRNMDLNSSPEEETFLFGELVDGSMEIHVTGAEEGDMKIEGRIKYDGFGETYNSPWISTNNKVTKVQDPPINNSILVPIIIGALVAVVVLLVVIFFVVKRKKSQNKYDCDTADTSEAKKLKEDVEA